MAENVWTAVTHVMSNFLVHGVERPGVEPLAPLLSSSHDVTEPYEVPPEVLSFGPQLVDSTVSTMTSNVNTLQWLNGKPARLLEIEVAD